MMCEGFFLRISSVHFSLKKSPSSHLSQRAATRPCKPGVGLLPAAPWITYGAGWTILSYFASIILDLEANLLEK